MNVEIWIDLICPWCFLGKRRFERALAAFAGRDSVRVQWHSYQLDASSPSEWNGSLSEWLAKRYGFGLEQARAAHARLEALGAAEGVRYDFEGARPGNTRDAHRLVHLATTFGKADAMVERLMSGYFEQRMPIGNRAALSQAALDVGLDAQSVEEVLGSEQFATDVASDQRAARERGFNGVPAFVLAGKVAVSGAQSSEVFSKALAQAAEQNASPKN